jgi:hypothetical protein
MNTKVVINWDCPYSDEEILTAFEHLATIFGVGEHSFNTTTHHWVDENGDYAESIQFTPGDEITIAVTTPQNHISALCCNECGDDKLAPEEGELGWFRCNCGILHTV